MATKKKAIADMTVPELKALAKKQKLAFPAKAKKEDLLALLQPVDANTMLAEPEEVITEESAATDVDQPETNNEEPAQQPAPEPVKENPLNVELTKFAGVVEKSLTEHAGRLPLSKAEAVNFIKKSNPKFRVEIKDADKEKGTHIISIFLGNEKFDLQPLKLH